ncbi:LacI family DNA-binding transcriptional regulator [Ideonella livida]|uniref:LacI family DNA-binding transcriptional regulator n=1 Tax=Ideonella livida TaxID=2707176 RepID=A0A7C9PFA2_9BURK|nr:LacI family DNA-binding transcriptional regulator [Ideonella livida]NDY90456.1 LacI family DNA-binding transcriptional regulator [Ideonella livida]
MTLPADDASRAPSPARRSRRGSGAVTLHDVARLAGVAPITASRALNTPQQVSDDVRQRVAQAVAATGYVPNRLAGGLASARSRLVAAVVPTLSGPVFLPTVEALTQALAREGYQLMLGQTGYDNPGAEEALLEAILGRRPDGIVLTGVLHSEASRQRLQAAGRPVVETWDLTDTPVDLLVGFSHTEVGRAVADFLQGLGHRHLAVVAGLDARARRRTAAFAAQAQALGLPPVQCSEVPAPTTLHAGRQALRQLLAGPGPRPQAVFCSSDLLALGVLTEARVQGLQVPADLAVVGFGDLALAADTAPALTSVRIDAVAIGEQAARWIVDRAEGRPVAQPVVDIGFEIVRRESA